MSITHDQRGAAAVEFAFILPVMLLLLWGIVTFGHVLFIRTTLSRAAEDAARAIAGIPNPVQADIKDAAVDALVSSGIVPASDNTGAAARRTWLEANLQVDPPVAGSCGVGACIIVRIRYPYTGSTRILPAIDLPLVGSMQWIPDTLTAEAASPRPAL